MFLLFFIFVLFIDFCKTCVAINPSDPKVAKNKIVFITGCKNPKCIADLKLTGKLIDVNVPYVLGSSSSMLVDYEILNSGETAYLTQLRITLPDANVGFTKIPSHCDIVDESPNDNVMLCTLNGASPLFNNEKSSMRISVDTSKLDGTELVIKAEAISTSDEQNDSDNLLETVIELQEFSDIEIFGYETLATLTTKFK